MISENLAHIRATIPEGVTLVAVSKYHPVAALQEAYDAGQRVFGESREMELRDKVKVLPDDIEWHFIGHLQTNKVKYIAPFVTLIHSIDSERLLDEVEKQAVKNNRTIPVLLQLHVAQEESKWGFTPDELIELAKSCDMKSRWPHVEFKGLMGMASFVDDPEQWRQEFRRIVATRDELLKVATCPFADPNNITMSFGMSEDYPIAIQEGSNMVRVGTAIFGAREY